MLSHQGSRNVQAISSGQVIIRKGGSNGVEHTKEGLALLVEAGNEERVVVWVHLVSAAVHDSRHVGEDLLRAHVVTIVCAVFLGPVVKAMLSE